MATNASSSSSDFFALIGDLYTRWTLDGLTEIAYAIATDFIVRPQLYQTDDIPDAIVNLRLEPCGTLAAPTSNETHPGHLARQLKKVLTQSGP
jgi:hypothetical protein